MGLLVYLHRRLNEFKNSQIHDLWLYTRVVITADNLMRVLISFTSVASHMYSMLRDYKDGLRKPILRNRMLL